MPQQLEQIVQRMIDAGESEDNIASVIKEYPKQQPSIARKVGRAALDALPGIGGIVGGVLSTPETLGAGTVPGVALGVGAGQGLRDIIGHATGLDAPSTPMEKAGNIAKETAIAGATGALLPGVVEAVRSPLQTGRAIAGQFSEAMPASVRRLGRMFPSMPKGEAPPLLTRPAWQTWETPPVDGPRIRTTTGTGFNGSASVESPSWQSWTAERPAGAAPRATAPASAAMSEADRAALARQGYPADVIARIEQAAGAQGRPTPMASHAPTGQAASAAETAAPPNLQGPRIRIGAERVGRSAGMTKEEVRQAAGPVLDETAGEASPILPKKALQDIVDTLKGLPKDGPEREAYVARATSGKTKWQVENIRRTLEHLGLIVPAAVAAPAIKEQLMRMMSSHQSDAVN